MLILKILVGIIFFLLMLGILMTGLRAVDNLITDLDFLRLFKKKNRC